MTWNEFVTQVEELLEEMGLSGDEDLFYIGVHLPEGVEEVGYDDLGIFVD